METHTITPAATLTPPGIFTHNSTYDWKIKKFVDEKIDCYFSNLGINDNINNNFCDDHLCVTG